MLFIYIFFLFLRGFFPSSLPLGAAPFTESSVPSRGGQIKRMRYHLVFFFFSKWIHMWHIWVQAWLITLLFYARFAAAMATAACLAESFLRQWKKRAIERREGGRKRGRALSSWPTSSVIMPWSWNEAFGSTPGFWEQRCELLMLAVGPAWHPLPFPSSPCLGRLPATTPLLPCWDCKEDQNKERDLFFTRLLLWPMTSPLQPPAPRFQPPSTFFPSCRPPSILFEIHHFRFLLKLTP